MMNFRYILSPLLLALRWQGSSRHIEEAMPPHGLDSVEDFRDTLSRLGYASTLIPRRFLHGKSISLPSVAIEADDTPQLLLKNEDLQNLGRYARILEIRPNDISKKQTASIRERLKAFHPLLGQVLVISLMINVMTIFPILYNRVIYDHVIASGTTDGMIMLVNGVLVAMLLEMFLRHMRNSKLSYFGARIDHSVSCSVFERLLYLPPFLTERASVSAQLARLKDFETVRDFFTGSLAPLLFEIPLILVYLGVMAIMAGWLTIVPVVALVCFSLLIASMVGSLRTLSKASSSSSTERQEFILETVSKLRAIKLAGMEEAWKDRYRALSGTASFNSFRLSFKAQKLETLSYILMSFGGIATLGIGVVMVMNQSISIGVLIASMMLIWRILAPVQICCASLTRFQQLASSSAQVQRLLSLPPEYDAYATSRSVPDLRGHISFNRVTLRYSAETEPAILGLTFEAKPGQVIAIKGNNGSGKSSVLKLLLGLCQPQAGSIRLDGMDMRQFDPVTLRQCMAYVPQSADFFPGTVRDNLRYAAPTSTDAECLQALRDACALEEISMLPEGLDTVIEGDHASSIPFQLRQKINLARAYIRPAPIMLFDEASYSLGMDSDENFSRKIENLRGHSTILLVTHREDHMKMADILLILDKGELTHAGPPELVLNSLQGRKAS